MMPRTVLPCSPKANCLPQLEERQYSPTVPGEPATVGRRAVVLLGSPVVICKQGSDSGRTGRVMASSLSELVPCREIINHSLCRTGAGRTGLGWDLADSARAHGDPFLKRSLFVGVFYRGSDRGVL